MIPFMGEWMVCIMSGRRQQSNPNVESGWDCIVTNKGRYFVSAQWREKHYKKHGVKHTWIAIMQKISQLDNER